VQKNEFVGNQSKPPAYGVHPAELSVEEPVLDEDSDGGGEDGRVQAREEPGQGGARKPWILLTFDDLHKWKVSASVYKFRDSKIVMNYHHIYLKAVFYQ
jgi:hypothetical protein